MAAQVYNIDIATRFLGEREDIYVIRPGENFSLYREFVNNNAIFLDFPDIGLDLTGKPPKREKLREHVVRSIALREWHRTKRKDDEPSRASEDYVGKARGRRLGNYVGAIERLYFGLREGTIIVVPGPGYFSDVLIGELVGKPKEITSVSLYPNEKMPVRSIKWIGKKKKAAFSEPLRDRLQKPIPLMALDRSLREEILVAAYDQFSIGDTISARFTTKSQDFSTLDDYNIQTFVNYVSGVLVAVETNKNIKEIKLGDALDLLSKHRDLTLELTSNINSPGALRLFSSRTAPLVVAVLFAIALASPAGGKPDGIQISNSAFAGDDPCALEVQAHAVEAIQMMDLDTWKSVCVQARDAAQSTGLSTTIDVVSTQPNP